MERAAHIETHRTLCTGLFAERHRALDAGYLAADHDLSGRVVVRGNDEPRSARRGLTQRLDGLAQVAKDRRHCPGPADAALVHELTAPPDDAERIVEA